MSAAHRPVPVWHEVAQVDEPSAGPDASAPQGAGKVFLRTAVPGGVVAVVLALLGRSTAAMVVAGVAVVVGVFAARSERFRRGFDRLLHAVGHWVGMALSVVLMGLLELFVFLPVSLVLRLIRHDPLKPGAGRSRVRWQAHPGRAMDRHLYAAEPVRPASTGWRRQARRIPRVVGFVAIVLALDLAVGWGWQTVADARPERDLTAGEQLAAATTDAEWFADYQDEMAALDYEFEPFVLTSTADASGRYVNITDGLRRTYTPDDLPRDPVTVHVFGGTNVWGDGQRDDHTIPSELARLAEEDGLAVRFVNEGQVGDVSFSAALRFERVAASDAAPDLVVFADGPDDYAVQIETPSAQPGQYGQTEVIEELEQPRDERSLWERYVEVSLLQRAVSRVTVLFSTQPAHASSATATADEPSDDPLEDLATRTAEVYERSRLLADEIGDRAGVETANFWLPIDLTDPTAADYARAAEALDPSVVDLSQVLDDVDDPVFLDHTRMNERGAQLVAAAMFEELRPTLERLQDE